MCVKRCLSDHIVKNGFKSKYDAVYENTFLHNVSMFFMLVVWSVTAFAKDVWACVAHERTTEWHAGH